jgi:hypothetical protein
MKTLFATLLALTLTMPAFAAETKKICNMQKDRKGKEVKVCKDVKVHKKLDGTKVPEKK